jgi:predicted transcriptional regulator
MAGTSSGALSGREYTILKVLWDQGPSTVREVRTRVAADDPRDEIPYTTVLSLLQLMEKKGYVTHEAHGKTYRYRAKISRAPTTRRIIRDFLGRFFDGSAEALLLNLVGDPKVEPEAWEKLRAELEQRRKTPESEGSGDDRTR